MQWKALDFPVLLDAANLLDVTAVPIGVLIDEHGTIVSIRPGDDDVAAFLAAPAPTGTAPPVVAAPLAPAEQCWVDGAVLQAIPAFEAHLTDAPDDARAHFRLGTAFMARAQTRQRRDDDFARAVAAWRRASTLAPNQYIYRRRVELYGPRPKQPYPFFDWIDGARDAITARGDTPHPLRSEPRPLDGAPPPLRDPAHDALVTPAVDLIDVAATARCPDPVGAPNQYAVTLRFTPRDGVRWNNEAQPMTVRVHADAPLAVATERIVVPAPDAPTSAEPREVTVTVTLPPDARGTLHAYALVHVCRDDDVCLYRRADVLVPLAGAAPAPSAPPTP